MLMDINAPKQIVWVAIIYIYIYIYAALNYLSHVAEDEFQLFLHRYLNGIEIVLAKC